MMIIMQKEQAHKLIDWMTQNATGEDLLRGICIRKVIEQGMADRNEDRTKNVKEVRA